MLYKENGVGFFLAITRFCYRIIHSMLYAYTNEIYNTKLRCNAIGFHSAAGRLATIIMPFVIIWAY
jgi:hypothetical protein